jgi:hypothetical protein
MDNLALACRSCNLYKSIKREATDSVSNVTTPLFNPRKQSWSNHFSTDDETLKLIGITAVGRVTIDSLRMNSPEQLFSRKLWLELGIFP